MALGADGPRVLRTVLSDAVRWLAWGLATGLALALALTPLVASMLYGVAPRDWATFLAVSVLLTAVGIAASAVPALRASRVDPLDGAARGMTTGGREPRVAASPPRRRRE